MNLLLMEEVRFTVPASLDACAIIRERVDKIACKLPFTKDDLDDIRLAVGEAASNAVRHGCRNLPSAEVAVCCCVSGCEIRIEVQDKGEGFDPESVCEPNFGEFPEGGMGIYYMHCSMDDVRFEIEDGTRVILTKRFHIS